MAFANGAFVTTAATGGAVLVTAMDTADGAGAVAYESGTSGPITVGGRLVRVPSGGLGVQALNLASASTTALAAKTAVGGAVANILPAAADAGAFRTAQDVLANTVNLPSNFGPGNGNWTAALLKRLDVFVTRFDTDATAINIGAPVFYGSILSAGDVTFLFKNLGLAVIGNMSISFRFRHSIEN